MAASERRSAEAIHPVHAVMLACTLPLFLGGLLSDIAYASTYEIQWSNFASWLIAGALVFAGVALAWSVVDLARVDGARKLATLYFLLLLAIFLLGLVNSFVHARDAWAVMPAGLLLSAVVSLLTLVVVWIGFSGLRAGRSK